MRGAFEDVQLLRRLDESVNFDEGIKNDDDAIASQPNTPNVGREIELDHLREGGKTLPKQT